MIDIETHVYDSVASRLRDEYDNIFVAGEYVSTPSSFPAVTITESDNVMLKQYLDSSGEKYVAVMYELNIYSNRVSGKKAEAKAIMAIADSEMLRMGFTRLVKTPISDEENATLYRIVARYTAVTDGNIIYRR